MCEFCIQHGEGKRWYLEMKNYSSELLHAPLTPEQVKTIGFTTREEWMEYNIRSTIIPAYGISIPEGDQSADQSAEASGMPQTEEQIQARRKIESFGQVLPIEDVEKVLNLADSITRLPCSCRYFNTGLANQRYCFGLGRDFFRMLGKYPESSSSLEVIDKEEALRLIRKFNQEGLIHTIWSSVTPFITALCNCDVDCSPYQHFIKERGTPRFFRGEYICQVDLDQCTGCKECMRQCQFGAQFYSSSRGKVYIAPERCFGCGVCRAACPQDAISLIPRATSDVAANIW